MGLEYLESDSTEKALHAFSMSLQTCNEELKIQISEKIAGISKADIAAEDSNNDDENEYDDEESTDETYRFEVIPGNKKEKVVDLRQKFAV